MNLIAYSRHAHGDLLRALRDPAGAAPQRVEGQDAASSCLAHSNAWIYLHIYIRPYIWLLVKRI